MRGKRAFLCGACALVLAGMMFSAGCGKEKAPETPAEEYGVVDLETLIRAHPRYSEYYRLKAEYDHLAAERRQEQEQLIRTSSRLEARMKEASGDDAIAKAAEEEYQAKLRIRQNELNGKLKEAFDAIEARHSGNTALVDKSALTSEDDLAMANLQLRLQVLTFSEKERASMEKELQDLLNRRHFGKSSAESAWTEEERQEMAKKKEAAEKELADYGESLRKDIAATMDERRSEATAARKAMEALPRPELWNEEWQHKLDDKKKAVDQMKESIMKDIREQSKAVAEGKHLTMIFSSYRASISAVDVTGDVASRLVHIQ